MTSWEAEQACFEEDEYRRDTLPDVPPTIPAPPFGEDDDMSRTATEYLQALDESVSALQEDNDYEAFQERQRTLWDAIHESDLQEEIHQLMREEYAKVVGVGVES